MIISERHRVFGTKEYATYMHREGAYLIPVKDGKIAVVKTPKGYFLLGGGTEGNETPEETITRECLEEVGYTVNIIGQVCSAEAYTKHPVIGYFHPMQMYFSGELKEMVQKPSEGDHQLVWVDYEELKGNMFSMMQNWAIEQVMDYIK
ncbi:MAG: NUDIX domain-containing protein [Clostridia bacterium]|nr:NUDIX domain-containing protein [Clostridia bacterium]